MNIHKKRFIQLASIAVASFISTGSVYAGSYPGIDTTPHKDWPGFSGTTKLGYYNIGPKNGTYMAGRDWIVRGDSGTKVGEYRRSDGMPAIEKVLVTDVGFGTPCTEPNNCGGEKTIYTFTEGKNVQIIPDAYQFTTSLDLTALTGLPISGGATFTPGGEYTTLISSVTQSRDCLLKTDHVTFPYKAINYSLQRWSYEGTRLNVLKGLVYQAGKSFYNDSPETKRAYQLLKDIGGTKQDISNIRNNQYIASAKGIVSSYDYVTHMPVNHVIKCKKLPLGSSWTEGYKNYKNRSYKYNY